MLIIIHSKTLIGVPINRSIYDLVADNLGFYMSRCISDYYLKKKILLMLIKECTENARKSLYLLSIYSYKCNRNQSHKKKNL